MTENLTFEPKTRFFIEIAFDGSTYNGWQFQPNAPSVQETIENTLTRLYAGTVIPVTGSSRTDAGVHACAFAASFCVPERPWIPQERIKTALNRLLPPSIRICSLKEVDLDFHARFDAKGKAYTYIINKGAESPFLARYSFFPLQEMDAEQINAAAQRLVGTHDFASFAVDCKRYKDTVRTIFRIDVQEFSELICITFIGNGFLYKMIRCIVGSLLFAGCGRLTPDQMTKILETRKRAAAHNTALPHGLFLMKVFYDEQEMHSFRLEKAPFIVPLHK